MIRFVFALRRKSGMSVADFQEHLVRKYGDSKGINSSASTSATCTESPVI